MKWTNSQRREALRLLEEGVPSGEVADHFGVTPGAVREAVRRQRKADQRVKDLSTLVSSRRTTRPLPARKVKVSGPPRSVPPFVRDCEDGVKIYVVATDVHVPYQDKVAVGAMADLMRDLRPDGLVLGGDFLDLIEVSSHSSQSVKQLEGLRVAKTFDEAKHVLRTLRAAGGPQMTENHLIEGNHENRLERWVAKGDNAVWADDEALSIEHRLDLAEHDFSYHPGYPEATIYLGKLAVTHGIWTTKNHAATHLDRFKHAVLYGHTHTPQFVYGSTLKGKTAAFGLGHMADVEAPALSYAPRPNNWAQGFGVVYVRKNGEFCVQQIQLWDGTFFYGGRQYGKRKR